MRRKARGQRCLARSDRDSELLRHHPSWKKALVAVLLALTLASAGLITSASAAGQAVTFYMELARPKLTLCFGEAVQYKATVKANPQGDKNWTVSVPGVKIEALVVDKSIGTINGSKSGFASTVSESNPDQTLSHSVVFEFKAAKKAGKTTIYFDALVAGFGNDGYVSQKIDVRVIPCKFKVKSIARFPKTTGNPFTPYPPQKVRMNNTSITVDENGSFSGTAAMHWVGASITGPTVEGVHCTVKQAFPATSDVTITAEVNERGADAGKLVLKLTYEMASANTVETCSPAPSVSSSLPYQLDTLTVTVPLSGGTVTLSQGQSGFNTGSVTVVVTAEKG